MDDLDEFFKQDDGLYFFATYLYSESLRLLYLKVHTKNDMFYIAFGPTIYHAGVVDWAGRKFYESSPAELANLVNRSPHLKNYIQDERDSIYKLYVFPSDTDHVLIVAAGHSLMRETPKIRITFS